jgi:hypothetical protein
MTTEARGSWDLGRVLLDSLAFVLALLPGVAGKGNSRRSIRIAQKLLLAIGERVHGVDNQRPCPSASAGTLRLENCVADRNKIAERPSGSGTDGHHEALACQGEVNGLRSEHRASPWRRVNRT